MEVSDAAPLRPRRQTPDLRPGAGIPEVWIVDANGNKLEHHTGPPGYRYAEPARMGQTLHTRTGVKGGIRPPRDPPARRSPCSLYPPDLGGVRHVADAGLWPINLRGYP